MDPVERNTTHELLAGGFGVAMSALQRRMLKRRYGEPSPDQALLHELAYNRSIGLSPASSSSAESPRAPVDQLPAPPASANASDSQQPTAGSNFVEPKPRDEGAKLTSGVDKQVPGTPAVRPSAHEAQTPETAQLAAQPTSDDLSKLLDQMLRAMFLGGSSAPRRSGMPPVADRPQLWLLVAVKKAAKQFWEAHEHEARSCCQPSLLSETEVRGYLANEALGNPLLPPGYGIHCPDAVGKRVHNGVAKAEKEEKAARKTARDAARAAARKGGIADPAAADKAAQAALAATYDLQLPGGARHHQTKTASIMSPQELSMVGGETQLTQLLKDMDVARRNLQRSAWRLTGAERMLQSADDVCERTYQKFMQLPWDSPNWTKAHDKSKAQSANLLVCVSECDAAEGEVHAAKRAYLETALTVAQVARKQGLGVEITGTEVCPGAPEIRVISNPSADSTKGAEMTAEGYASADDDFDGHFHVGHRHPCSGCRQFYLTPTKTPSKQEMALCEKKCSCSDGICSRFPMAWDHRRRIWCRAIAPLQDGVFVVSVE